MTEEPISLTLKERMILANQFRILEALYPGEAGSFKTLRTIVESGYEAHYSELGWSAIESNFTLAESREVMDILDMYRTLNDSYNRLTDNVGITKMDLEFAGFDGNNEPQQLDYARFLVLNQGRWREILEDRPGFDLNSHSMEIEIYRRMLSVWSDMDKKRTLAVDEIKQILEARIHPENRP